MFTLRTLTAVGLALVLTAGAYTADKKSPSGKNHAKPKVQQPNQSHKFGSVVSPGPIGPGFDLLKAARKPGPSAVLYAGTGVANLHKNPPQPRSPLAVVYVGGSQRLLPSSHPQSFVMLIEDVFSWRLLPKSGSRTVAKDETITIHGDR